MIRFIKKLIIIIIATIILVTVSALIYLEYNKDSISSKIIEKINEQLAARVEVEKIDLTLLHHFPQFTANLKNVIIFDPPSFSAGEKSFEGGDTLLCVEMLHLDFDISGLLNKNIILSRLVCKKGRVYIKISKRQTNYRIFKEEEIAETEKALHLDLKNFEFHDIRLYYYNVPSGFMIKTNTRKTKLSKKRSVFELNSEFYIDQLWSKNKLLTKKQMVKAKVPFSIEEDVYKISRARVEFADLDMRLTGELSKHKAGNINLNINAVNKSDNAFIKFAGKEFENNFKLSIAPSGLKLEANIKGKIAQEKPLQISLNYKLEEGKLLLKNKDVLFEDLSLSGNYNNGKLESNIPSSFTVNDYSFTFKKNTINGNFYLRNLRNPHFEGSLAGDLDLYEVQKMLPSREDYSINGLAHVNISLSGKLDKLKNIQLNNIEDFKPEGHIELLGINAVSGDNHFTYNDLKGSIMLGKHFWMDNINGNVNGSQFILSGEVRNVFSHFAYKEQNIVLKGNLHSPNLKLDQLLSENSQADTTLIKRKKILFPKHLIAKIEFSSDNISLGKFDAKNMKGTLIYEPGKLYLNSLFLETMDGAAEGNSQIFDNGNKSLLIQTQTKLKDINIKKLFYSMNNFSQDFITEENLNGDISGDFSFYSLWSDELKINKESIVTEGEFNIKNGELNHFAPIQSLSKFIAVEELENIKFSELSNTIYIINEKIIIPKMNIYSSAFNITAAGTHYFNNNFNYKLKVLLVEILAAKARRNKKENSTFGIIEDDGLGKTSLYLNVEGTGDGIEISYDRKEMMNTVKQKIQKEKENLRSIFNEKSGSSDKTQPDSSEEKKEKHFRLEWEEEDSPDSTKTGSKKLNLSWEEETDTTGIKND